MKIEEIRSELSRKGLRVTPQRVAILEAVIKLQYDKEMDNLSKFGDQYLALQSIERSKNIASGKTGDL